MALPKSVLDLIDFKSYHISRYADMVERLKSGEKVQFGPNTKVVILTHSAQVTGTLIDTLTEETNESETESQIFIRTFLRTLTESLVKELSGNESGKPVEKAAFSNVFKVINLKDAQVTPFADPQTVFSYSHLTLYTDQVVGITFGE